MTQPNEQHAPPAPPVISLVNQKGGVSKTTTTANVGHVLAEAGWNVLVIDMDTQANLTSTIARHVIDDEDAYTAAEVMAADMHGAVVEGCAASAFHPTEGQWSERLHILPGSPQLALRELDQVSGRETRLRRALMGALGGYDVVLIDCPPSLGQLTVNALAVSDTVYIPTEATRLGLHGVHLIRETIKNTREIHNPKLSVAAVVVTRYNAQTTEAKIRVKELEESWGDLLYSDHQPIREVINKAIGACHPVSAYGAEGREAREWYESLATHMTEQVTAQ